MNQGEIEQLKELVKWLRTTRSDLAKIYDTTSLTGEKERYDIYKDWYNADQGIVGIIRELKQCIGHELCDNKA